ncbi:MAG: SRPBCC family protein [Gammaproteobacteria bacterium]|jgi:hypothetical protein|nr:SRPBCC family protein [Gammaproteobacteria bacterium]MBT5153363.1 SRPBCC family protein [Gammaproteobacteria bacterium]MBT5686620.1 SRPBCC family protein [Gammaproteobacteria bacterium]MBT5724170.1 SRPBCC family protein [Gammaproteobacteria bacterium]MBT6587235.1 SRPBCC family protein [Gammaproteobacteria bacterium]
MNHSVSYSRTIEAGLETSWSALRDFGSLIHWVKGGDVGSITVSGDGVGMTRDLNLPSVGKVQHCLEEMDEANHLIAYSLTRGQPLGMQEYVVSISLRASADGCDMKWEGEFDAAPEVNAEELASNLKHAYEGMTELFERFVGN